MSFRDRPTSCTFTRLHARVTEEDGAFTVSIRMLNHLKSDECAWGQEVAPTLDIASSMIDSVANEFSIEMSCISIKIIMDNFKSGTFH